MIRPLLNRRHWIAGLAAAVLALPASAQEKKFIPEISGLYLAEGRNPDGSAYQGTAVVAEYNGLVQINWTVGGSTYSGRGTRDGAVVVVEWGQDFPVIYVVLSNGDLHGTWQNGTALERLLRR